MATTTRADKHLIAPGSLAGTVVQALRQIGPARAAELAQIAAPHLSPNDKKTLASTAVQAASSDRSSASDRITASLAGDLPRVSRAIRTVPREAARARRACGIRTP
ncbi:hypothetical protein EOD23_15330 [Mesorhizobium sp. USDA-HM6]|nr:hypothetical protein EOD23_15330 [Mesorhizobium sp. USDA-HM6]